MAKRSITETRLRKQGRQRQVRMALNPIFIQYRSLIGPVLWYWLTDEELDEYRQDRNYGHWIRVARDRWFGRILIFQFSFAIVSCGGLLLLAFCIT